MDKELYQLLILDIPESPKSNIGFLEICDQTTHENTISNVYRYFLDPAQSPQMSELMIGSLMELIDSKHPVGEKRSLMIEDFKVHREVNTGKGRIDIVIEDEGNQSVVIIEAKVYHALINDLDDYWDRYPSYSADRKAAIVLSPWPYKRKEINNSNYISITHTEWLNKVAGMGLPFNLSIRDKIYFTDFVRTINELTNASAMNEEIMFYLEHAPKINRAIETKKQAFDYILDQFRYVAGDMGWKFHGTSEHWRHLWDDKNEATAYYAIYPQEILNGEQKVRVILEIYGPAMAYEDAVKQLAEKYLDSNQLARESIDHKWVKQIVSKTIVMNSSDEFKTLGQKVLDLVRNDLEPLRLEIMNYLATKGADKHH